MLTVVIPCRNEALTIGTLVQEARGYADRVVVANDSSTDRTADWARDAGAEVVQVPTSRRGLVGVYVHGLQHALRDHASDDIVVEMDAGGSHAPKYISALRAALVAGADVAAGTRFEKGSRYEGKLRRKALSWGGTVLTNMVHGTQFTDATSGFIAYRAPALQALLRVPYRASGHFYQTEVRLRAQALGLTLVEVPISYRNSSSSLNWRSIREALQQTLLE